MLLHLLRAFFLVGITTVLLVAQTQTVPVQIQWTDGTKEFTIAENETLQFLHFEEASYDETKPQIPIFSTQIKLQSYGRIRARLVNTTYAPISDVSQLDLSEIPTFIEPKGEVSFARKQPIGIVYFVPIRKNQTSGQYEKLLTADLQIQLSPQAATAGTARSTFQTVSKLNNGDIYKIAITNSGIQKIDYDFLKKLGVDVDNIDPRNIQILGNGGKMLSEYMNVDRTDDLLENAIQVVGESDGKFDANDYILFYGVGTQYWDYYATNNLFKHRTNIYTDKSYYFIKIANNNGKRISDRASLSNPTYTTEEYDALGHHEVDEINLMEQEFALPPSGREWYGESFRTKRNRTFYFPFSNRIETEPINIYTDLAVRAFSRGTAELSINNTLINTTSTLSTTVYIYSDYAKKLRFVNTQPVITGQNLNVDIKFSHAASSAELWLNYISIHTRCGLSFTGGQMDFRDTRSLGNTVAEYQLSNASNVYIWDISDPSNIVTQNTTGTSTLNFGAEAMILREFIAFDGSQFYTPETVGKINNQNLHGIISPPEALFICHSSLRGETERLAAHRRSHSHMTVEVVNVEDIYNEFSSGNEDITAIRDFCRMLYARETSSDKFTHLLLMGIGSFDYKSLGKDRDPSNNPNLVPLYQTSESIKPIDTYTSDDYYSLLDSMEHMSRFSLLDIAVGRLPAANVAEAAIYVNKIIAYDTDADFLTDWKNRLLYIADDEDNNLHFLDAQGVSYTASRRDSIYNIEKVYLDAFKQVSTSAGERYPAAKNAFLDAIFKGSFVVNYLGHGGEDGWTQERVFTSTDIPTLSNQKKLPLFITATCSFGPHDDPLKVSAAELLLLHPYGGAIALFTTVRVVVASHNERLVKSTFNVIFQKDANGKYATIGQVLVNAKNGAAIRPPVNSRKFSLLGDPTMTLSYPKYKVRTLTINGHSITGANDTIRALEKVTISGQIADNNGNLINNFNGIIYPTIFDKVDEIYTLGNDPGSYPAPFGLRKKIIFKGQASVTNGRFSFSFVVPKDINYTLGFGKISYYASNKVDLDASGHYAGLTVGGAYQGAVADNQGPEVLVYMNTDQFARGGLTNSNPNLLVKLYDDNGINTVGNSIGHDLTATLTKMDGTSEEFILNDFYESTTDDYRRGTVLYPLKNLAAGRYHVKVKAWDTYNNPGQGDTEFIVAESADLALQQVLNYPNPFTTATSFQFEHNYPYQDLEVQIQVYTVSGKLVKTILHDISAENNNGYRVSDINWDGLDDYGDQLAKGVYIYKILLQVAGTTEKTKQVSKFQKLVILK